MRIVPDGYPTRDSDAVRALNGDFIVRTSPGSSVEAVAPLFLGLVADHGDLLRTYMKPGEWPESDMHVGPSRFGPRGAVEVTPSRDVWWLEGTTGHQRLAPVHIDEVSPAVQDSLQDAGLASVHITHGPQPVAWMLMKRELAAAYKSVLAEDFATANMLQPTTDQDGAYAVASRWTTDRIAAMLLDDDTVRRPSTSDQLAQTLGFLALDLVVPANLDTVPIQKIIDIRERYGAEFLAFGQAVDEAAAAMAILSDIRDQAVLDDYLHDVVAARFALPLDDLRRKMKALTGDVVTMSVNVKTELPAGVALAAGAWAAGHPLLAGTGAAAIGLMVIRRGIRQQRETLAGAAPAASFLLHTEANLRPRNLLDRTVHRLARIAGTNAT
ncbi:DUF6236 family protein [Micromonospora sp. NPDC005553]|uniref:DUF6236 family protein n=1 Tax=Micromonospora sp. NPDC005553 TaxID=3364232 RepID=UPI0036B95EAE